MIKEFFLKIMIALGFLSPALPPSVVEKLPEVSATSSFEQQVQDSKSSAQKNTAQGKEETMPSTVKDNTKSFPVTSVVVKQEPKEVTTNTKEAASTSTPIKLVNVNGVTVDERYADVVRQQMLDAMVQKQQAEDLIRTQQEAAKREADEKAFQVWYDTKYLELKKYSEYLMSTNVQENIEEANRKFYSKPIPTINNYKTW